MGMVVGASAGLLVLAGCSSAHYRRSADREVYRIIEQAEDQIFGYTNTFTIDTRSSARDPNLILPAEIVDERTTTNLHVVGIEAALNLAVRNSREYQTEKERLYLTALSLTGARYQFSPQFFGDANVGYNGNADGLGRGVAGVGAGLSQLLKSGANLSVSLANDFIRYYSGQPPGASRSSAINAMSVRLTQPILRGFGQNNPALESLTQAERNVIYAIRTYSQYQHQFAVDIVNDYFTLLNQKVRVRNFYTNYLRRVENTRYFEARSVDRASMNVVEDARSSELSARIQYVTAVASYLSLLDTYKLRLGVPVSEGLYLDDSELGTVESAGPVPVDISREAGFRLAVDHHLDILNAIDRFEDSKRKIRRDADRLRPGLTFVGSANVANTPPDYTDFDARNVTYSLGLELDLPFDRLRERNDYRQTLVAFQSDLRTLQLTLDRFKQRIDGGLRNLEEARLNIVSQQRQLEVETRRVDMSTIRLEAGRVDFRDLREAQDALISAQNNLTASIVAYLRNRLQLLLDLGMLESEVEAFWLKDPLAELIDDSQRGPSPLQMPRDTLIPPDQFLEPAL
jgi:outer membrane protein TolC